MSLSPKAKAIELIDKFYDYVNPWNDEGEASYKMAEKNAKKCALIAVNETLRTLNEDIRDLDVRGNVLLDLIRYWQEIKREIESL